MNLPHNILVPVDLEQQTGSVLDYAAALAAKLDARIHLLHVLGRPLLGAETGIVVTETMSGAVIARCQHELARRARPVAAGDRDRRGDRGEAPRMRGLGAACW